MLKVGELAARAGLTVRTLHHYDSIGLLSPSARSDAGYRLYDRDDVARLQQIQALRAFGMALADIGAYLDSPDASPLAVVERQLSALDRQIAEAAQMREQLLRLRTRLAAGEDTDLSIWLTTLEQMRMYEQYFSKEELARLPLYQNPAAQAEWRELVRQAQSLIDRGVAPETREARAFAERWLGCVERDSGGDPDFILRLTAMTGQDAAVQKQLGLAPALLAYMRNAINELRFGIYARYLPAQTVERMRRHEASHSDEWIALAMQIRACMREDPDAQSDEASALARRWFGMFTDMVGDDPEVVAQFRRAASLEPMLHLGTGIGDDVIGFLRKAGERMRAPAG
ncbi:MerR family transcriptional regulator [Massilia sp. LjRoot122]|uniref:MerR family transcriptional regulator n=1 Tax=Massilia sp. LjRoot122 TaxID=3342257 RepID=UPI003ECE4124